MIDFIIGCVQFLLAAMALAFPFALFHEGWSEHRRTLCSDSWLARAPGPVAGVAGGIALAWNDPRLHGDPIGTMFADGGPWNLGFFGFYTDRVNPFAYDWAAIIGRLIHHPTINWVLIVGVPLLALAASSAWLCRDWLRRDAIANALWSLAWMGITFYTFNLLGWLVFFSWKVAIGILVLLGLGAGREVYVRPGDTIVIVDD